MSGYGRGQFTDEERSRLGAQQAAILQMQKEMEASAQQQYDEDQDAYGRSGPPGMGMGGYPPMPFGGFGGPKASQVPQQTPPPPRPAQVEEDEDGLKLPKALEEVLAYKEVRVQQVGLKADEAKLAEQGEIIDEEAEQGTEAADEDDLEEGQIDEKNTKESKSKRRKRKKKKAKQAKQQQSEQQAYEEFSKELRDNADEEKVEVEYVPEDLSSNLPRFNPHYQEFARIFEAFKITEPSKKSEPEVEAPEQAKAKPKEATKVKGMFDEEDEEKKEEDGDKVKMSKKKMKKLSRLSVAELKQLVTRPDVVEMHDVTARDPKLLIHMKATKNTVPVPRHWCYKRKYLQGKRGFEKPPFELPEFIKNTGIMEMRSALSEKEDQKTLKMKMRERVRPKMGKIDIDYQKLHDAFFKYQIKPKMSVHGDLYYEGKEFETKMKDKKPGNLSEDLRTALGMPIGPGSEKFPPPWLIAMQRYGPPPSYPNQRIAGLTAPIPEGCSFGYHAGGWGKPPVDETGKPLYGDVFGTQGLDLQSTRVDEDIDRSRWGELESESESEVESEEEGEGEEEIDASGLVTPGDTGLVTPSGVSSVPVGVETPDMIELRKKRIEDAMDQGGDTPALYQVLQEKKVSVGGGMMGSTHIYDIGPAGGRKEKLGEGIEVALNPDELELDTAAMQAKYDQTLREQQSLIEKEDLTDMVADHAARQQKKRKKQQQDAGKAPKKYKEFKF